MSGMYVDTYSLKSINSRRYMICSIVDVKRTSLVRRTSSALRAEVDRTTLDDGAFAKGVWGTATTRAICVPDEYLLHPVWMHKTPTLVYVAPTFVSNVNDQFKREIWLVRKSS